MRRIISTVRCSIYIIPPRGPTHPIPIPSVHGLIGPRCNIRLRWSCWCLPGAKEDDHDDERNDLDSADDDEDDDGCDDNGGDDERDDLDEDCGRVELLNNRLDGRLLRLVFTICQILTNLPLTCI